MQISTKELRIQPGRIIEQVVHGKEVTVTFRGKPLAKIVPIDSNFNQLHENNDIFGMWQDKIQENSVEETVRQLRQGRIF